MPTTVAQLVESASEALAERVRLLVERPVTASADFVLYWMRTAVRADENPALEFAIYAANQLSLPVFVYHALSEKYTYASDRHHTFILEGARDVSRALAERELGYGFHLERPGNRGPHLQTLVDRSALVVTEDMPVDPLRRWTKRLARQAKAPLVAVDTACVVPMQLVGKSYERAFAYRNATKKLLKSRLGTTVEALNPEVASKIPTDLPFEPLDIEQSNIASLVSECEIDHSIGPVPHTPGGSSAGYDRWAAFCRKSLNSYARTRNDPLKHGVSRLSPYLHYGMVSPMRIAREAYVNGSSGAEKFLDELLIWRELAYAFCFYRADHGRLSAIPAWAKETLAEHESDARTNLLSWETLARGETGDALWDAAQKSLLIHGELHNNVRMTWGKAILNWTTNAKAALACMIDLNHRYALDGRDPASYGGLLWCLGQFDRPFTPAQPIFGTVRGRSTKQHATRLDPNEYRRHTTRSLTDSAPTIAVIGAGLSGLLCARTLQDHGLDVKVFEKSRGPGGRMSTRRTDEGLQFDHGAQYFTVRDQRFRRLVDSWIHDGVVARWDGQIVVIRDGEVVEEKEGTDRYVAVPGMNAIGKHLAADLDVSYHAVISTIENVADRFELHGDEGKNLGTYDLVISTAPATQTQRLLAVAPNLVDRIAQAEMSACWAVMIAAEDDVDLPFDGAFVHESILSWVACNSAKPGREENRKSWILHASSEWSEQHIEDQPDDVQAELIAEFWRATGRQPQPLSYQTAHRWRYALPTTPLPQRCLFDAELGIGVCGDWCGGPRVEGAFLSGAAMAGRVLGQLGRHSTPKQQQLF